MQASPRLAQASPFLCLSLIVQSAFGQVTEDAKLNAADAAAGDTFGFDVAVDANRVLVSSIGDEMNTGAVYAFDKTTGMQTAKLMASNGEASDEFGRSVAIFGNMALVGAHGEDGNDDPTVFLTDSGTAYLFDLVSGQELSKLRALDPVPGGRLGFASDLSGDTAVLGAYGYNGQAGAVYLFDVTTGQQTAKLVAADGEAGDRFGHSVAISGDRILVGSRFDSDNGSNAGSAYVFDRVTGQQVQKLLASDGAAGDTFGESVAIDGDWAVIGADSHGDAGIGVNSGAAYVFDLTTGAQVHKLLAQDLEANDFFGGAVSISNGTVAVSCSRNDDNGKDSGSIYLFDLATGQQLEKLLPSDGATQDFFGYSLDMSGDSLVTGTPFDDDGGSQSGSAYLFELDAAPTSYCEPAGPNSVSPTGAVLTSAGEFGTSQATFNLMDVPDTFGLLFAGSSATDVAFGCGRLCVGGTLVRGAVVAPSGNQLLDVPFDMSPAGLTHIQYWFRDPGFCATGFNLSNALTL